MNAAAARRFWGAAALLWCALIFFLSSQSNPPVPGLFDKIPFSDKIAHAALYAVLATLARFALRDEKEGAPWLRAWLIAVAFAALYGASDEFHQRFVVNRTPDIIDWLADVSGASMAAVAFRVSRARRAARK